VSLRQGIGRYYRRIQLGLSTGSALLRAGRRAKLGVQIEDCTGCGGKLKIIASIEEPAVIARILAHLEKASSDDSRPELAPLAARAPPAQPRRL
jgi:hypothetical protein